MLALCVGSLSCRQISLPCHNERAATAVEDHGEAGRLNEGVAKEAQVSEIQCFHFFFFLPCSAAFAAAATAAASNRFVSPVISAVNAWRVG